MNIGEIRVRRFAGLREQNVVSRSIRYEGWVTFGHVTEKRDRVSDCGNSGVRLDDSIVELDIGRGCKGGDDGVEQRLCIGKIGGFEGD